MSSGGEKVFGFAVGRLRGWWVVGTPLFLPATARRNQKGVSKKSLSRNQGLPSDPAALTHHLTESR